MDRKANSWVLVTWDPAQCAGHVWVAVEIPVDCLNSYGNTFCALKERKILRSTYKLTFFYLRRKESYVLLECVLCSQACAPLSKWPSDSVLGEGHYLDFQPRFEECAPGMCYVLSRMYSSFQVTKWLCLGRGTLSRLPAYQVIWCKWLSDYELGDGCTRFFSQVQVTKGFCLRRRTLSRLPAQIRGMCSWNVVYALKNVLFFPSDQVTLF